METEKKIFILKMSETQHTKLKLISTIVKKDMQDLILEGIDNILETYKEEYNKTIETLK